MERNERMEEEAYLEIPAIALQQGAAKRRVDSGNALRPDEKKGQIGKEKKKGLEQCTRERHRMHGAGG